MYETREYQENELILREGELGKGSTKTGSSSSEVNRAQSSVFFPTIQILSFTALDSYLD